MKKFFLMAFAVAAAFTMSAQDLDIEAIAKLRNIKADSLALMLGKVYGTQNAMNHTTSDARVALIKAFDESINIEKQDEQFREGSSLANEFFKVAQDMKKRNGIDMKSQAFAQAMLDRFADTTIHVPINQEVQAINAEAKNLIQELTAMHKDTTGMVHVAVVDLKSDSLSRNMGRFYGMQLQHMANQKNLTEEQKARLIEGFNSTINVDESNKPLIDGRLLASEFGNIQQSIKKQMGLNINKDKFISSVLEVLNDPKVPTSEDFKAVDTDAQNYFRQTQAFAQENSPEALTNRTLGKKYIENIMEKDPGYIQTPSGLVYKMLEPGKGNKFEANDKIKVMYKGTHVDGKTFDESKEPITFAPSQVVPGFREALLMMRPGAKMIAVLPQDLAYGARGAGKDIKPYETLVFEIETLGLDTEAADAKPAAKPAVKNAGVKAAEAKPANVKASTPADTTKKATSTKKAATTKKATKKSKRK